MFEKNKKIIVFLGVLIILGVLACGEKKSYSQDNSFRGNLVVDKPRAIVNKKAGYYEISSVQRKGITGIIIFLDRRIEKEDKELLKEIAIRGYNPYVISKNNIDIAKDLIKKDDNNMNWILVGKESYVERLKEWMVDNKYKAVTYGEYKTFNRADMTREENIRELNNKLNILRNNI